MGEISIWKQGDARKTAITILLALFLTVIATIIINPFENNVSKSVISESTIIPLWTLVAFRTIVAICGVSTLIYVVVGVKREALLYHTTSKEFEIIPMGGLWRLSTFTCWSFLGLSLAFTTLALCSWAEILGLGLPNIILQFAIIIYPVIFANSLFVTMVVTFILIPQTHKRGDPLENWFKFPEQMMHNLNTVFLVLELVLGNLPINLQSIPLVIIFGISYVIFAAYNEKKTGIYFYSFLDPRSSKAAIIHIALLLGSLICFGLILLLNILINQWYLGTIIFLLFAVPFILYVKEPVKQNTEL